jgi:hypothetical protein
MVVIIWLTPISDNENIRPENIPFSERKVIPQEIPECVLVWVKISYIKVTMAR